MNPRSIHFRLTLYHGSLMALTLAIFALASYWGFRRHLIGSLESECANQTHQIAESLMAGLHVSGIQYVRDEIEEHYAPETNNLFVRILGSDGTILYESGNPHDKSFDPPHVEFLPSLRDPQTRVESTEHRLVFVRPYTLSNGESYQIQMAASLLPLEKSLGGLWKIGVLLLPFALTGSVIGGALLTRRLLKPIRDVVATARLITSLNLKERLVEKQSGDEIQDLARTLNEMLERLEVSFKQMVRFTADASHELRTPLTIIRGNLELLLSHRGTLSVYLSSEECKETMSQTLEETERVSKIVRQLMELTQLDSGEIELERERFDLSELVGTTTEQMKLLAEDKEICLEADLEPQVVFTGDRYRIKQVLLNLIDNAIKYCPSGSEVNVRLFREAETIVLEVFDNGPGIPPDALRYLFDRFYRLDKARSRELGGCGLGLSICKSICEGHGGRIETRSQRDMGTTFRVTLPALELSSSVLVEAGRLMKNRSDLG